MTWAYVTEFAEMPPVSTAGQIAAAALFPELASYQISNVGGSTQSAPFQARTKFVRVNTDAVCSVAIGANPTAVATKNRMSANSTEYFGVRVGAGDQIAIIANT